LRRLCSVMAAMVRRAGRPVVGRATASRVRRPT
jgi:hypothetical protein